MSADLATFCALVIRARPAKRDRADWRRLADANGFARWRAEGFGTVFASSTGLVVMVAPARLFRALDSDAEVEAALAHLFLRLPVVEYRETLATIRAAERVRAEMAVRERGADMPQHVRWL